ncbi:Serine/threonine-protein kinase PITSLRE [Bienertia sinuspersici]
MEKSVSFGGLYGLWRAPKLRHFRWIACRGMLAANGVLTHQHVLKSGNFSLCGDAMESIKHALFECKLPSDKQFTFSTLAWATWTSRNKLVFIA